MATQLTGPVMPIKTVSLNFFKISLELKTFLIENYDNNEFPGNK